MRTPIPHLFYQSVDVDVATHVSERLADAVHFHVNDDAEFSVPVVYTPPVADVVTDGHVHFGDIMNDGEVHTKYARLINKGSAPAAFRIVPQPELASSLRILPEHGRLAPAGADGSDCMLRVEFTAKGREPREEEARTVNTVLPPKGWATLGFPSPKASLGAMGKNRGWATLSFFFLTQSKP